MQTWMLYHLRRLLAAERCGAFRHFGGLSAQLNLVAIVLNSSITESVNLGLSYFRISSSKLEENARMRVLPPASFANLLNADQLDAKERARLEVLISSRDGAPRSNSRKGTPSNTRRKRARALPLPRPREGNVKRNSFPPRMARGCETVLKSSPSAQY